MKKLIGFTMSLSLVLALSACMVPSTPAEQPAAVPKTMPTTMLDMIPTTVPTVTPTTAPAAEPAVEPTSEPLAEMEPQQDDPMMPEVDGEKRQLTDGELEAFAAMFRLSADKKNWYNFALTSIYEMPEDLDLLAFFYSAPLEELTQADLEYYGESHSVIHKYSVSVMDQVLEIYFGMRLADTNGVGLDRMVFNEEGCCYYHQHGDFRASYHTIFEGYASPDNTVELYYIDQVASVEEEVVMVVTLRYVDQGPDNPRWQVVSNLPLTRE